MVYPKAEADLTGSRMAEHEPGSMDITEQERTFEAFVRWTIRTVVVILVSLVLLGIVNG